MSIKTIIKKKRFWFGVATAATAVSYAVSGDVAGAVRTVAAFFVGS